MVLLIVIFELLFSLVTCRKPNQYVTRFANRVVRYGFEIGQYLTFVREEPPFPFDEFPNGAESASPGQSASARPVW